MIGLDSAAGRRALLVLAVLDLIWGYSWVLVKVSLMHAPPFAFAALRGALATVFLFAALRVSGRSAFPKALGACMAIGFLQTGVFIALTSFATLSGGVGRTSVLVFTMPFWTLVFARVVLNEKIRGTQWIAIALAAAGLLVIVDPTHLHGLLLPSVLAVLAGAVWGASAVLTKRIDVASRADPLSFTAWQLLGGTLPLIALAALVPGRPIEWDAEFLVALTFNGVIATGLGWLLWAWVLKRLPAGTVGLSTLAIPLIAVLGAWLQLGERPPTRELVGMAMIGVALLQVSRATPRRAGTGRSDRAYPRAASLPDRDP